MRLPLWCVLLGCADVSRLDEFDFVDPVCEPEGLPTTCFGVICGSVTDNCGNVVDCMVDCPGTEVCGVGTAAANTCGCTSGAAPPAPPASCLQPFGGLGVGVYYLCEKVDFEDGRELCRSFGTDLVIIDDAAENAFVHGLIPGDGSNAHIGLWDPDCMTPQNVACDFTWVDDRPPSYTNWKVDEPNNVGGVENCAEMDDLDGGWNDVDCNARRHVICETTCVE